jgi:hypothetical protein
MDLLTIIIIFLAVINLILYAFNKYAGGLRRSKSREAVFKQSTKNKLLEKITELKEQLRVFDENHVGKDEYNNLIHKYNILLNEFRKVRNKNDVLDSRIKKLKNKIY